MLSCSCKQRCYHQGCRSQPFNLSYCDSLCVWHAGAAAASAKQQHVPLAPSDHWPSTEQIAAAAQYHKEAVAGFKQRAAVPADKYVIPPEPLDMRAQHSKVCSSTVMFVSSAQHSGRKHSHFLGGSNS
jgi:hypothetical protein